MFWKRYKCKQMLSCIFHRQMMEKGNGGMRCETCIVNKFRVEF